MLKIFVTGDNHIGLKYASHHNADVLVSKRIDAFDSMVESANNEGCGLFVITGDLFENNYNIAKKTISVLLDKLACFKGVVVVLPGNHDYYDKDAKLWQYFEEAMVSHDNIILMKEYHPYTMDIGDVNVTLYPAHCTSKHSAPGVNNLGWIKETSIDRNEGYHIGLAHGAVEGETIDNEGAYFLMKRDELESIPVDAWLIGHTHVPFPRNLTVEYTHTEKIFNAGTHVQTDVSCNTEGQCFVVEINDDKAVRAKKIISGNVCFCRKHIKLTAEKMEESLKASLADLSDDSVVDLILSGAVTSEEYTNRVNIMKNVLSRFLEGTYKDHELSRLITEDLVKTEFSETSFSAGLLNALLNEPKEAQLAYELLKSLKEDK